MGDLPGRASRIRDALSAGLARPTGNPTRGGVCETRTLSDAENAAYFAERIGCRADCRVRTSIDLELALGATCGVA